MKRAILDDPAGEMRKREAFVRVRDEGDKITLTYKQFDGLSVDGAKEIETRVNNFADTVKIFEAIGLGLNSIQETKRETWKLGQSEVVLDEWPWLKPYIEIEGEGTERVKEVASRLGFDWNDAVFGDVMAAYRAQYPHLNMDDIISSLPEVSFGMPLPDLLKV